MTQPLRFTPLFSPTHTSSCSPTTHPLLAPDEPAAGSPRPRRSVTGKTVKKAAAKAAAAKPAPKSPAKATPAKPASKALAAKPPAKPLAKATPAKAAPKPSPAKPAAKATAKKVAKRQARRPAPAATTTQPASLTPLPTDSTPQSHAIAPSLAELTPHSSHDHAHHPARTLSDHQPHDQHPIQPDIQPDIHPDDQPTRVTFNDDSHPLPDLHTQPDTDTDLPPARFNRFLDDDDHAPAAHDFMADAALARADLHPDAELADADLADADLAHTEPSDVDAHDPEAHDAPDDADLPPSQGPRTELLVNYIPGDECRIAIIEDGKLEEFHAESLNRISRVGNIYLGRVRNVEPGIQAAFIDFGVGENAFLHFSDLHPRYFGDDEDSTERVGKKTARRERPPIERSLRRGQEIMVQVSKEGVGTKGPAVTSYLSIPGRYLVMMPFMDSVGVSQKEEDEDRRRAARKLLDTLDLPKDFGWILRTAGLDRTKAELKRDVAYLLRLWKDMERRRGSGGGKPRLLYSESDLLVRTLRDQASGDIDRIVIDSELALERAARFMRIVAPRSAAKLALYKGVRPIFHAFNIEEQINLMHAREVPLPSGGRLVIDETEALVAIDVNSGRMKGYKDAEENAFRCNIEAVDEICRQLRLRDLGGLIINDLIDMRAHRHRREIENRFKDRLRRDRAKSTISGISQFGILEMTRQRMRGSHESQHFADCPHCRGRGMLQKPDSVAGDALRELSCLLDHERVGSVELVVSPRVAATFLGSKRPRLNQIERRSGKTVQVRISDTIPPDRFTFYAYAPDGSDLELDRLPRINRKPEVVDYADLTGLNLDEDASDDLTAEAQRAKQADLDEALAADQQQADADRRALDQAERALLDDHADSHRREPQRAHRPPAQDPRHAGRPDSRHGPRRDQPGRDQPHRDARPADPNARPPLPIGQPNTHAATHPGAQPGHDHADLGPDGQPRKKRRRRRRRRSGSPDAAPLFDANGNPITPSPDANPDPNFDPDDRFDDDIETDDDQHPPHQHAHSPSDHADDSDSGDHSGPDFGPHAGPNGGQDFGPDGQPRRRRRRRRRSAPADAPFPNANPANAPGPYHQGPSGPTPRPLHSPTAEPKPAAGRPAPARVVGPRLVSQPQQRTDSPPPPTHAPTNTPASPAPDKPRRRGLYGAGRRMLSPAEIAAAKAKKE